MSFRLRLNLILLACLAVSLVASAAWFRHETLRLASDALVYEARTHMQAALAIREYTIEDLKPLFDSAGEDFFTPSEVPAHAASKTLALMYRHYPGYEYREATENPTNPADQAQGWERELIDDYRAGRRTGEQLSLHEAAGGRVLSVSRPLTVSDPACLRCHSDPGRAPAQMRRLFPGEGGFHWRLGEIVGAQIVSVPAEIQTARAEAAFADFLRALLSVSSVLFMVLNVLLNRMVLRPLNRANDTLDQLAGTDALTGTFNRRALGRRLQADLRQARGLAHPVSAVAFDLDHFKQVNDTHGHAAGDEVLRCVSAAVRERLRQHDTLARTGGEEFLVVLPRARATSAARVAEALRQAVRAAVPVPFGPVTASFGVVQWDGSEDGELLLARADQALYAAKHAGRNRVEVR
jgi:diguanylate cyclase (GGDEF)-like protein